MQVDFSRCRVEHPSGIVSPGRFIFEGGDDSIGIAAVWVEMKRANSATRALYGCGTFIESPSRREPHRFVTETNEEWIIKRLAGGGG